MFISNNPLSLYKIIISTTALEGERDCAEVLRDTLIRTTDCSLNIDTDNSLPTEYDIVIGKTNRDTEKVLSSRLKIKDDDPTNSIFPFEKERVDNPNLDILDPEKIEKWSKGVKNGNTADNISLGNNGHSIFNKSSISVGNLHTGRAVFVNIHTPAFNNFLKLLTEPFISVFLFWNTG